MTEAMNDPQAAHEVGMALSRMLPDSAPVLTNILAKGNVFARCNAADALMAAFSYPESHGAVRSALLHALHDPDAGTRMCAASSLEIWKIPHLPTREVLLGLIPRRRQKRSHPLANSAIAMSAPGACIGTLPGRNLIWFRHVCIFIA